MELGLHVTSSSALSLRYHLLIFWKVRAGLRKVKWQVVDGFRELGEEISSKHFSGARLASTANRVEFLPVNWHDKLHGEDTGTDSRIQPLTLRFLSWYWCPDYQPFSGPSQKWGVLWMTHCWTCYSTPRRYTVRPFLTLSALRSIVYRYLTQTSKNV